MKDILVAARNWPFAENDTDKIPLGIPDKVRNG